MANLILLYIYDFCLAVYFGSSVFMGFVAAPAIFKTLETREKAGHLVGLLLDKFAVMAYALQTVMIIAGSALFLYFRYPAAIVILPLVGMRLNAGSSAGISLRMKKLKEEMGKNIDDVPKTDKNRVMFNNLHKWSVRLFILSQFLMLFLFYYLLKQ